MWSHRGKGLALLGGAIGVLALVLLETPGAVGAGIGAFVLFGVLSMDLGLAWPFTAGRPSA